MEIPGISYRKPHSAKGPAAVINSAVLSQSARTAASETWLRAVNLIPEMISDDFSFYTEHTSGAQGLYLKIGTGIGYPLHHPKFKVGPNVIVPTAGFISKLLLKSLCRETRHMT